MIAQVTSLWLPQGLLFTLPAWATLGAAAIGRARPRWAVAVLAAIALIGLPVQLAFRAPDGHQQATRELAEIIDAGMRPGDGVVYGSSDAPGGWVGRVALARYLPVDRRPEDVLATGPRPHRRSVLGRRVRRRRPAASVTRPGCG